MHHTREDGRALFPVYLLQVKPLEESKSKWDLKVVATAPADQAGGRFRKAHA
jgi:hypothetical protein